MTAALKVHVDRHRCEGHGLCVELAPKLFDIDDDDVAKVSPEFLDDHHSAAVKAAAAACPRQAINIASSSRPPHPTSEGESTVNDGPLTQKVIEYQNTVRELVTTAKTTEDWAPLSS